MRSSNVCHGDPWSHHRCSPGNPAGRCFSSGMPGEREKRSIPEFGRG